MREPEKSVTVWVQRFKDRPHLVLQWIDPDTGKRKSRSAGTADEKGAEQARADLAYELNHGRYQETSRMTWERFRELFEEEYLSNLRKTTRERYEYVFNLFEQLAAPKSLRSVFPLVKVPKKKPQPIPAESFERLLLNAPDANTRAFLHAGWLAGLRLAEALELEWEASPAVPYLDLARNRVVLPAEFAKSDEDQWVPLDPALREELVRLPRHGRKVFRFVRRKSGRMLTPNGVSQRIIRLAKRAGVRLTMHSLRKGFGCHYAADTPAQVLQRLMRHGDIKTTMTYYANVDAAAEAAVARRNNSRNSSPVVASPASAPINVNPYIS